MDNVQKVGEPENLTPEAIQAEEQVLKGPNQDEIRSQVIEKYGFNEDEQADLIDKLVADKVEEHKRLSKAIQQKRSWREKANKPPEKPPEVRPVVKPEIKPETDNLSQKDLIALIRANVSDDDISEVSDYARLKEISVAEALKAPIVRTLLKEREEERKSAEAANTGGSKRISSKLSEEALMAKAQTGELSDDDIERLAEARLNARKKKT